MPFQVPIPPAGGQIVQQKAVAQTTRAAVSVLYGYKVEYHAESLSEARRLLGRLQSAGFKISRALDFIENYERSQDTGGALPYGLETGPLLAADRAGVARVAAFLTRMKPKRAVFTVNRSSGPRQVPYVTILAGDRQLMAAGNDTVVTREGLQALVNIAKRVGADVQTNGSPTSLISRLDLTARIHNERGDKSASAKALPPAPPSGGTLTYAHMNVTPIGTTNPLNWRVSADVALTYKGPDRAGLVAKLHRAGYRIEDLTRPAEPSGRQTADEMAQKDITTLRLFKNALELAIKEPGPGRAGARLAPGRPMVGETSTTLRGVSVWLVKKDGSQRRYDFLTNAGRIAVTAMLNRLRGRIAFAGS